MNNKDRDRTYIKLSITHNLTDACDMFLFLIIFLIYFFNQLKER